jgi:protein FRA10AC1
LAGKGESNCSEVDCDKTAVNIFEMNFGYMEEGIRKNALVKVSVCKDCAFKLNYRKTLKKVR